MTDSTRKTVTKRQIKSLYLEYNNIVKTYLSWWRKFDKFSEIKIKYAQQKPRKINILSMVMCIFSSVINVFLKNFKIFMRRLLFPGPSAEWILPDKLLFSKA